MLKQEEIHTAHLQILQLLIPVPLGSSPCTIFALVLQNRSYRLSLHYQEHSDTTNTDEVV